MNADREELEFIKLLVQILQLPLILIIGFIFLSFVRLFRSLLFWSMSLAFFANFCYIIGDILTHECFYEGLHISIPLELVEVSKLISQSIDNLTYIFFFLPLYHRIINKNSTYRVKQYPRTYSELSIYFIPYILITIAFLFIWFWQKNSGNLIICMSKFLVLSYLPAFLHGKTGRIQSIKLLIYSGFFLWALLQFIPLFTDHKLTFFIGFVLSFVAKSLIFLGLVRITVVTEKQNTALTQLKESNKRFEGILRYTFHEIDFPIISLGGAIGNFTETLDRQSKRSKPILNLEFDYERVNAIIKVARDSYKSDINENKDEPNSEFYKESEFRTISVNYLLEKASQSVLFEYEEASIEHQYRSNVLVRCNNSEVVQIFTNLIKNAIEAYEDKFPKTLIVRSMSERISKKMGEEPYSVVIVEIEDFASGILEENKSRIWERGVTTKTQSELAVRGEGLYVVQQLCKKNGIIIELESPVISEPNQAHQGSKFTLIFKKQKKTKNEKIKRS